MCCTVCLNDQLIFILSSEHKKAVNAFWWENKADPNRKPHFLFSSEDYELWVHSLPASFCYLNSLFYFIFYLIKFSVDYYLEALSWCKCWFGHGYCFTLLMLCPALSSYFCGERMEDGDHLVTFRALVLFLPSCWRFSTPQTIQCNFAVKGFQISNCCPISILLAH